MSEREEAVRDELLRSLLYEGFTTKAKELLREYGAEAAAEERRAILELARSDEMIGASRHEIAAAIRARQREDG